MDVAALSRIGKPVLCAMTTLVTWPEDESIVRKTTPDPVACCLRASKRYLGRGLRIAMGRVAGAAVAVAVSIAAIAAACCRSRPTASAVAVLAAASKWAESYKTDPLARCNPFRNKSEIDSLR